jgi:hypothetical protein
MGVVAEVGIPPSTRVLVSLLGLWGTVVRALRRTEYLVRLDGGPDVTVGLPGLTVV